MKVIKETYTSSMPVTKTVEMIETTDGRKFHLSDEKIAKDWQRNIDEIEELKKSIAYKNCNEVQLVDYSSGHHTRSFMFTVPENPKFSDLKRLTNHQVNMEKMKPGVTILCIEYLNDLGDSDYHTGYIGPVNEYVEWLTSQLNLIKSHL